MTKPTILFYCAVRYVFPLITQFNSDYIITMDAKGATVKKMSLQKLKKGLLLMVPKNLMRQIHR